MSLDVNIRKYDNHETDAAVNSPVKCRQMNSRGTIHTLGRMLFFVSAMIISIALTSDTVVAASSNDSKETVTKERIKASKKKSKKSANAKKKETQIFVRDSIQFSVAVTGSIVPNVPMAFTSKGFMRSDATSCTGRLQLTYKSDDKSASVVFNIAAVKQLPGPTLYVTEEDMKSVYLVSVRSPNNTYNTEFYPFFNNDLKPLTSEESQDILTSTDKAVQKNLVWKAWCRKSLTHKIDMLNLLKTGNETERQQAIRELAGIWGNDVDNALNAAQNDIKADIADEVKIILKARRPAEQDKPASTR